MTSLFDLTGRVAIITGGAGLLGRQHAAAIREAGGTPVIWDNSEERLAALPHGILRQWGDIASRSDVTEMFGHTLDQMGRIDILINNAARNSETGDALTFEQTPLTHWIDDFAVGLMGAFLCSQIIGGYMAANGGGVIVNIGSDFAHLAPNPKDYAPRVKPASYSVVKHGLLGLTRYLAAYWAEKGVRVNMLSPGGVENGQGQEFVSKIAARVPMGRMAQAHEFQGALVYLCSDASKFVTGQEIIVDGGRAVI